MSDEYKPVVNVLGIPLYAGSIPLAVQRLITGCSGPKMNRCVSATGAHGLVHARSNPDFRELLRSFHLNLPDGMPAVWVGRMKGASGMERCYGPDFFLHMMQKSAGTGIRHFLCGGAPGVAERLRHVCETELGNRDICGTYSPPWADVDEFDYPAIAERINSSGADVIWVGISTPKQEQFAARLARHTDAYYLITVGAAFDFHIGNVKQAPGWMQKAGLEWFFRLCMEPRRLWRRYSVIVPMFLWLAAGDLLRSRLGNQAP